ncbi:hypothetical protein B5X24_HaOG201658 [Helicoverpa armigera]|nr:hypothetical protein B5X24_HaOG201658 [Helicoverpa armigera]
MQPEDAYHPPLAVRVGAAPPAHRDHSAPSATPTSQRTRHSSIAPKLWNFNKADFNQLYNLLSEVDWRILKIQSKSKSRYGSST